MVPGVIEVRAPDVLGWQGRIYHCVLGRAGIVPDKREGDGGTPSGILPLRRVFYRPDRLGPPVTGLPLSPILPDDGWCDDPADPAYNRHVRLPHPARHEVLWRLDGVYDVIVVLGWNDDPVVPGKGSAIFMHVARADHAPTEGCVALALPELLEILADCRPDTLLRSRAA